MNEIRDLLKRSKINAIVTNMMYDGDTSRATIENYDKTIDNSYETVFSEIKKLCPNIDIDTNELFDAICNFALIQSEIYFEAGLIAGFQLCKQLDGNWDKYSKDILNMIKIIEK